MLGDHFDLEDLGASELKGFAEPVPVWRVGASRFAATRTGSAAPLVGRQEEMGLLLRAWEGSSRGRGPEHLKRVFGCVPVARSTNS